MSAASHWVDNRAVRLGQTRSSHLSAPSQPEPSVTPVRDADFGRGRGCYRVVERV